MLFQGNIMPDTGDVVPGARAYRWPPVKHRSNFLRWGTETEMSLISSSTSSFARLSTEFVTAPLDAWPVRDGSFPTRRRFWAGSSAWTPFSCSSTNPAILLNSLIREGESVDPCVLVEQSFETGRDGEQSRRRGCEDDLTSSLLDAFNNVWSRLEYQVQLLRIKGRRHNAD